MRRFLALLIVLMMFGICSSSYGFFLVYKLSASVKGADDVAEAAVTVPLKTYLLLNLDDANGVFQDANLIIYGKDAEGAKVYFQLNDSDTDDLLDVDAASMAAGGYYIIDFWATGEENPFEFEGFLLGKTKAKDIGFGPEDLWLVAPSLKGSFIVWLDMLFDADQDISGTSNISATLDNATTKMFNSQDWTQDEAVTYIRGLLQGKGYSEGTLPAP